ncbi:methyl-accepting chemotaxis protein, partial [Aduncisulcus paluster]
MREFLDEAINEIKQPERAGLVAKADAEVREYGKYFEKIEKLRVERNHYLDDVLNVNGPLMEQKLTRILQTAERDNDMNAAVLSGHAMRNLLLARLYVLKFLEDNTEASANRVKSESQGLNKLLEDLELENNLDKLGPSIAQNIEDVKLSVMSDQNVLGPKLQAANNQAIMMAVGISLIALAVGIVTAGFIIRTVNRQLGSDPAEIANIAQSIAGGDLDFKFKEPAI